MTSSSKEATLLKGISNAVVIPRRVSVGNWVQGGRENKSRKNNKTPQSLIFLAAGDVREPTVPLGPHNADQGLHAA